MGGRWSAQEAANSPRRKEGRKAGNIERCQKHMSVVLQITFLLRSSPSPDPSDLFCDPLEGPGLYIENHWSGTP